MGTRGRIGIQLGEGVLSVYHHWDSYPEWLGKILVEHYNTRELVEELIDGGDMSVCWSDSLWGKKLPKGKYAPEYYSLRGEDCPPMYNESVSEYIAAGEEYHYIFTKDGWVCYNMNEFNDKDPEVVSIPTS